MTRRQDPLSEPEELIRRIYSYAAYVLGDGADAEDVTSATIERALRYRDRYEPHKGEPISWLLGIARRCIADHLGEIVPLANDNAEAVPEPEDAWFPAADRLTVQAAVAALGARDRDLVGLRYGADLTAAQIGELLGVRTNAVEVALHRLHARLRRELVGEFAPPRL